MSASDNEKYDKHFSDNNLWRKLYAIPSSIGRGVAIQALLLYALLVDGKVPVWAKALIVGGPPRGYLILPVDAIPEFIPVGGYTDDAAAMGLVLRQVREHVTPAIRERAENLLPDPFHEYSPFIQAERTGPFRNRPIRMTNKTTSRTALKESGCNGRTRKAPSNPLEALALRQSPYPAGLAGS